MSNQGDDQVKGDKRRGMYTNDVGIPTSILSSIFGKKKGKDCSCDDCDCKE